jgi:hypothetical protein
MRLCVNGRPRLHFVYSRFRGPGKVTRWVCEKNHPKCSPSPFSVIINI